jgi:hypothetical protein
MNPARPRGDPCSFSWLPRPQRSKQYTHITQLVTTAHDYKCDARRLLTMASLRKVYVDTASHLHVVVLNNLSSPRSVPGNSYIDYLAPPHRSEMIY